MTDHSIAAEPKLSRSPGRAIAITLAVLLVSWYCFPAAVDGWADDHCVDGPWCSALQGITEAVDSASRSVGVAGTLEGWRDQLRRALGIDFY
jgi:hypothetical protein